MSKLYTRFEYDTGICTHKQYYAGLVYTLKLTVDVFDDKMKEKILNSRDSHLNDVPLKKRDFLAESHKEWIVKKLHQIGVGISLAGLVCIMKELARQYIESVRVDHRYEKDDNESRGLPKEYID